MSRKRPVNQLKWTEDTSLFNKDSIKKLKWRKWWRTFSRGLCSISWKIHDLYNELSFFLERMKLVTNLHDRTEYVIHTKKI